MTVDAAKYGSAADQWMDSGIEVDGHAELAIVASGRVDLWQDGTGQYATGPNGYKANAGLVVMGNQMARGTGFPGGALVGRIGEGTEAFLIGENYKGRAARRGKLYLHIAPSPWGNASVGTYKVVVNTGGLP